MIPINFRAEMPVTINGGMRMPSWFDLRTLNKESSSSVDVEGIKRACSNGDSLTDEIFSNFNFQ